jgi:hypothetical protein
MTETKDTPHVGKATWKKDHSNPAGGRALDYRLAAQGGCVKFSVYIDSEAGQTLVDTVIFHFDPLMGEDVKTVASSDSETDNPRINVKGTDGRWASPLEGVDAIAAPLINVLFLPDGKDTIGMLQVSASVSPADSCPTHFYVQRTLSATLCVTNAMAWPSSAPASIRRTRKALMGTILPSTLFAQPTPNATLYNCTRRSILCKQFKSRRRGDKQLTERKRITGGKTTERLTRDPWARTGRRE